MDRDFFPNTDYLTNRDYKYYNLTNKKEYDNEIDRLRDELFSYVEGIDEKEKELKFLYGDVAELKARLKNVRKVIIEFFVIFALVIVVGGDMFNNMANGVSSLRQIMTKAYMIVMTFLVGRAIYRNLHHLKPDIFIKIDFLIKEESLTYQIEEKSEQIEHYQRDILELKERIRQLREEIAKLEAKDN